MPFPPSPRNDEPLPAAARPLSRRDLLGGAAALAGLASPSAWAQMTPQWKATAETVAARGVPLSALAPNAPDRYVVKSGDTLWDISAIFLKSPWRWPELWGMNLDQIRNPHRIFPGQVLELVRDGDRAMLRIGQAAGGLETFVLSPRARESLLPDGAIATLPLRRIGPFLNEAVVLEADELAAAPRVVAAPDARVLVGQGEVAYVRGVLGPRDRFAIYREARPLVEFGGKRVLGWEARFVGNAQLRRLGSDDGAIPPLPLAEGQEALPVPATVVITRQREEVGPGDRLAPLPAPELAAYVPRAPAAPVRGRIISLYGDAMSAGQQQIVTLDRGRQAGLERGHVVALWHAGDVRKDRTIDPRGQAIRLPDEQIGVALVFRVFEQVSYALVARATDAVRIGDRFSEPDPHSP